MTDSILTPKMNNCILSTDIKPEDCIIEDSLEEIADKYFDRMYDRNFYVGQMIISGYVTMELNYKKKD